ncbi:DUF4231 domain-containing protein [Streptomyces sp. MUM 203J]|uniref:DUF4231 domain-containing protein n=1 Tax=Streptomyces sp. MUM 203J TaxID=2791990 RepID=UPI001F04F6A8|nr:DUF4231 domain-containing protein [Streptomyces sp. MUM 203J]MCH0539535.1 DUF4231 domain-containing protein [Streptomyces sp. MUM 203J]
MVFRNADLPALFHRADELAVTRQREAVQATRLQLFLLVLGALLAAVPGGLRLSGGFQLAGALSASAYAGVLLVTYRAARRRPKAQWRLNRSAAEFIKSMSWRYAVHGAPFTTDAADADRLFVARLEDGLAELRKVGWQDPREAEKSAGLELITPAMRMLREKPFRVRKETYVRDRLIEQRTWYHRRQVVSRHATALWSATTAALTLGALLLGLLRAFSVGGSPLAAALLTAAAAASVAWSQSRSHQPLIAAHALVEQDLAALHTAMETHVTETDWPTAVYETERVVSPQHTDWLIQHRA